MIAALHLPDPPDGTPAGPSLELDAQFGEMERAAQGKPESQYGKVIEPATEPDWKETARLARALSERSRDLRILGRLAMAELHVGGLPAYAAVVKTIREHLETMWTQIHPQLDPEDDNDPLQRSNALLMLQDPGRVLKTLRDLPLASAPREGVVTWRDIAILSGSVPPEEGRERLTDAAVRGRFAATDRAALALLSDSVESLVADVPAISGAFDSAGAAGGGPDLSDLSRVVREIARDLKRYEPAALNEVPVGDDANGAAEDGSPADPMPRGHGAAVNRAAPFQSIALVSTREDAIHALGLAAAYFTANEPSSPAPLLIDRVLRLASLSFMDILRDLAPDGLQQAQTIVGKPGEA